MQSTHSEVYGCDEADLTASPDVVHETVHRLCSAQGS